MGKMYLGENQFRTKREEDKMSIWEKIWFVIIMSAAVAWFLFPAFQHFILELL